MSTDVSPDSIRWRKALRSIGNGNCVEVAPGNPGVAVRDSKVSDSLVIEYSAEAWRCFTDQARRGIFDPRRLWCGASGLQTCYRLAYIFAVEGPFGPSCDRSRGQAASSLGSAYLQ